MLESKTPDASSGSRLGSSEIALIVGGLALFLVLLYTMQSILHPIILGLATGILLWPLKERRAVRAIMLAAGFLLVLWLVSQLGQVLLPFVLAYLLAYLFNPIVDVMKDRFSTPRWVSSLLVTLLIVGSVALFFVMLVPSLAGEVGNLAQRVPAEIDNLKNWLQNSALVETLVANGMIDSKEDFIAQFTQMGDEASGFQDSIPTIVGGIVASLNSLFGLVAMFGIIPILLFYTLKDYPEIKDKLVSLFPTFGGQRDYLMTAGDVVGDYLRGQLTISAIAAVIVALALSLLGVPFGLLIGIMAGVLNLIPSFGIIITYAVGVLIALVFSPADAVMLNTIYVVGVLVAESFLESTVLTPNIMGQKLGLHPVLILLALFVFGSFMGLVGLLIAVPATALLVTGYQASQGELTLELSAYTTTPTVMWSARNRPQAPPAGSFTPQRTSVMPNAPFAQPKPGTTPPNPPSQQPPTQQPPTQQPPTPRPPTGR